MKRLSWIFGIAAATFSLMAAAAAEPRATASSSTPVCGAGPTGDRPAGMDADGDGVADSEDWCPRSGAGDHVGANGCAAGEIHVDCERIAGAPQPAPRVVPVALEKGDSDRDGIADADDRCPATARGVEVDKHGCAVIEKVVLKGVNFNTGSAKLKPEASDTLKSVASAMKADMKIEVEIDGYTDSVGDEAKNQALSERRANSVKVFLVNEGIDDGRLSTKGYGESSPADTNDTPEGRANNRRVSFKVGK
jgi:outer membrane protein OmpA-like peptidoglycan-associated protein